jgi:predicted metalloendopeptidase
MFSGTFPQSRKNERWRKYARSRRRCITISTLSWLDEATRQEALGKLDAFRIESASPIDGAITAS